MEITGTSVIPAPQGAVWNALNDPDTLRHCLPGCESVERTGADAFKIVMTAAVGPLKARFNGLLRITDAAPPSACVLVFEGQGGAMGFGKGSSNVALREVAEGTELTYSAQAQVGGKLAQVGSRLIDSVAKKMSDDFFKALRGQLSPKEAAPAGTLAAAAAPVAPPTGASTQTGSTEPAAAAQRASAASIPATHAAGAVSNTIMVPGWWLGVAACIGALATLAGGLLLR